MALMKYWKNGTSHDWKIDEELPEGAELFKKEFLDQFQDAIQERAGTYSSVENYLDLYSARLPYQLNLYQNYIRFFAVADFLDIENFSGFYEGYYTASTFSEESFFSQLNGGTGWTGYDINGDIHYWPEGTPYNGYDYRKVFTEMYKGLSLLTKYTYQSGFENLLSQYPELITTATCILNAGCGNMAYVINPYLGNRSTTCEQATHSLYVSGSGDGLHVDMTNTYPDILHAKNMSGSIEILDPRYEVVCGEWYTIAGGPEEGTNKVLDAYGTSTIGWSGTVWSELPPGGAYYARYYLYLRLNYSIQPPYAYLNQEDIDNPDNYM